MAPLLFSMCFSCHAPVWPATPTRDKIAVLPTLGRLAQLVRALRSHRRGHKFESCAAHFFINSADQRLTIPVDG